MRNTGPEYSLVPPPKDGRMCSNRNHLVRSVTTPYLLMVDDDCSVHPRFSTVAMEALVSGEGDIATATAGRLSFDFRGFWSPAAPVRRVR